jgi:hypothetical protein
MAQPWDRERIAKNAPLTGICSMSRWGPPPLSTDHRLAHAGGETKAAKPIAPSLSEVIVEARFPAGALFDMIVDMFQNPLEPPELAETACQTLVHFWRHPAALRVLISASGNAARAYAALQELRRSRKRVTSRDAHAAAEKNGGESRTDRARSAGGSETGEAEDGDGERCLLESRMARCTISQIAKLYSFTKILSQPSDWNV